MKMRTVGIATSTLLCTALLSVGWSEQRGVSLSIESAQARVGRPLTPVSVAGVARRHNRRAAYGYGGYGYGAAVAGAAAVGTAAAVASSPSYGGWGGNTWSNSYAAQTDPHYGQPFYAYRAYHGVSPYYGYSGWDDYAARSAIRCAPGGTIKLDDGHTYMCQ
jgi:hypothetical protein